MEQVYSGICELGQLQDHPKPAVGKRYSPPFACFPSLDQTTVKKYINHSSM